MPKLSLPRVLVFAVVATGAAVGATCGDGGTPSTADAGQDCSFTCVATSPSDAGAGSDAGVTCPVCANQMRQCPSGCEPLGLA
ncbi:MAG: hypothetical protein QOI66_4850 [Myxococcales bacterium]|jgi:hypothetical protein|nr:hypothetical protein [Myxococcales bacterium]